MKCKLIQDLCNLLNEKENQRVKENIHFIKNKGVFDLIDEIFILSESEFSSDTLNDRCVAVP